MNIQFLKYLLYLELNPAREYATQVCFAMKSGSQLPFCNRACAISMPSEKELRGVINFFTGTPFRWFVDGNDQQQIAALTQNGFSFVCRYPGMDLDLAQLPVYTQDAALTIKTISSAADIQVWVEIVAQSYSMDAQEFGKFIAYLQEVCQPGSITFYMGYYQGIPVATTVTIQHEDVMGVHWVGTLPAYRGKGIGYAMTHASLVAAQQKHATRAILMASELGKSVYDKMGFQEIACFDVYQKD